MNTRNLSVCTLGLALAMSLNPGLAKAASHCKGLEQQVCGTTAACRWNPARVAGDKSPRTGLEYKRSAKAHCRLDVKAAGELAAASIKR